MRTPYQKTYSEYATLYGVSVKTIQRYAAKGYPLDDEQATRARVAAQRSQSVQTSPPNLRDAPRRAQTFGKGKLGLAASIGRLRQAEADAHADYENADDQTRAWRLKEWLQLADSLRALERDNPDIEEKNKESVAISEVSLELAGLFRNLRADLDNLGKRLAPELVGKDALAIKETIDAATAVIVLDLFESKYMRGGNE